MHLIEVMHSRLLKANEWILDQLVKLAMVFTGIMTAVVLLQVFCRYFLNSALSWPEEMARFMMVWLTFLVVPYAYHKGMNVSVEIVVDKLHGKIRQILSVILHLLIAVSSIYLFIQGYEMMMRGTGIRASSVDLKLVYVYSVLPLSFGMLFVVATEKLISGFLKLVR